VITTNNFTVLDILYGHQNGCLGINGKPGCNWLPWWEQFI